MSIPAPILEQVEALPTLPRAALELNRVLGKADASPREVTKVVRKDPALTANLLRIVNSAAVGLRREVTSVDQAVSMLGQRGLLRVASMALLGRTLPERLPGYDLTTQQLWSHCAAVAVLAERLAGRVAPDARDLAFTAGLLHDIGKLAVGEALEGVRFEVLEALREGERDLLSEERARLGTDHTEVGALLAERWAMPEGISACVAYHHAPSGAPPGQRRLVEVVHVANGLAHALGFGADVGELHRHVDGALVEGWGLEPSALPEVVSEGLEDILELSAHAPASAGR